MNTLITLLVILISLTSLLLFKRLQKSFTQYKQESRERIAELHGRVVGKDAKQMNLPVLRFHKVDKDAKYPIKAHESDSGYDMYAISISKSGDIYTYETGIAFDIPEGYEVQLRARSSVYKTGLMLTNGIGTIDQGFTQPVSFKFYNLIKRIPSYQIGDRIGQAVLIKKADHVTEEMVGLPLPKDRVGGFGSTGLK